MSSLPKTVTQQRRDCDLNPGPTAPESSALTTRVPRHPHPCVVFLAVLVTLPIRVVSFQFFFQETLRHSTCRSTQSNFDSRWSDRSVLFVCRPRSLDPRVSHTHGRTFSIYLCHSGESCPGLHVVHPGRAWSSSPACTWHCSLHYLFLLVFSWCDIVC